MFNNIISFDNLLLAWKEFIRGKKNKLDVQKFELKLIENILELHIDLINKKYRHSKYYAFNISDPKPRNIHKASVRDRLLHHAIYRILYPHFDKRFIHDSYSCRLNKGTHKAIERFKRFGYKVSKNNTKTCWILKCDIRKFFASIDHETLIKILRKHIKDEDTIWLLEEIISSFTTNPIGLSYELTGLPLGNLTSQLLVNVYMNEFDQFIKHKLKVKYYIRYADDFILMHQDKQLLTHNLRYIVCYLNQELKLQLHPNKVSIRTLASGVDFLGWVHFPNHRVLRTVAKNRMLKNISIKNESSYLGLLEHGNTQKIKKMLVFKDNA